MNEVVKIVNKSNNPLPAYQSMGAAGMDIQSAVSHVIEPNDFKLISTGIFIEMPMGLECQVRSRSGLASKGVTVLNSPGTIDSDYRGEIKVLLLNQSSASYIVNPGDRIAQLVFNKVEQPTFVIVEELESTERGEGGFGSTGK